MNKIGVFTLQGPLEGQTMVILDKYSFVDGKMRVSYTDALLMRAILCNHYGCALSFENSQDAGSTYGQDVVEGSLAVQSTKLGQTINQQVANMALQSALDNAMRVQDAPAAPADITAPVAPAEGE